MCDGENRCRSDEGWLRLAMVRVRMLLAGKAPGCALSDRGSHIFFIFWRKAYHFLKDDTVFLICVCFVCCLRFCLLCVWVRPVFAHSRLADRTSIIVHSPPSPPSPPPLHPFPPPPYHPYSSSLPSHPSLTLLSPLAPLPPLRPIPSLILVGCCVNCVAIIDLPTLPSPSSCHLISLPLQSFSPPSPRSRSTIRVVGGL